MLENHPHLIRETQADGTERLWVVGPLAIRVFVIFASAYMLSYAFRAINAVIAKPLVQELGLSASQLGLLASAYFLSFGLMQLPVGLMLDRYGPRRVEATLMIFAALGALWFASADSFAGLWMGRALIGIGVSACLMASIKAYALYFKPHLQASMSSWMLMAGSLGALSVTTPVEALLPVLGWRGVFVAAAVLCVAASLTLWFVMPTLFKPQKAESVGDMAKGFKVVFRHPHFWRVAPLATLTQGGFMAFHGLWVGPWFTDVVGYTNAQAAQNMFWISAAMLVGYFLVGQGTRTLTRRGADEDLILVIGLGAAILIFASQLLLGGQSHLLGWLLHGFTVATGIMTYTTCNKPFPRQLTGRSSTALNLLIFAGAFSVQWGIGLGIDFFQYLGLEKVSAIRVSLGVLCGLQVISWVWFVRPGRRQSHLIPLG
ncbi:MAG TPA: MFS transporter [Limnobacter sp.]|uniref:MFS transporter n=1 Tax=Limnobacter sp. TaxID=2003368 RepID=UPI002EDAAAAE